MASSFTFNSVGFRVSSAINFGPEQVALKYTRTPNSLALVAQNYSISGPGSFSVISVLPALDNLSFYLILDKKLVSGTYTVTVSNVLSLLGATLQAPATASFSLIVDSQFENPFASFSQKETGIIRKHLQSNFAGPIWDALIFALESSDETNRENARSAAKQLFLSSASGIYLKKLAVSLGVDAEVNLDEETFRKYSILNASEKLTQGYARELLQIFFGKESSFAFVDSEKKEPFSFSELQNLKIQTETILGEIEVLPSDFQQPFRISSDEMASVLNRKFRKINLPVISEVFEKGVRLYSTTSGMRSSISVVGGSANNSFKFPKELNCYVGTVTAASGYVWTYSNQPDGLVKITLITPINPLIDLSLLSVGDYVNITSTSNLSIKGSFEIIKTERIVVGVNLSQSFFVKGQNISGSGLQLDNSAFTWFSPLKSDIFKGNRTVIVSQTKKNIVDIFVPATSENVNRDYTNGAYLNENGGLKVVGFTKKEKEDVLITTESPSLFQVGDLAYVEGSSLPSLPFVYSSPIQSFPNPQKQSVSYSDFTEISQQPTSNHVGVQASKIGQTQNYLFVGGYVANGNVFSGESAACEKLNYTEGSVVTQQSVNGERQDSYFFENKLNLAQARQNHIAVPLGEDKVLVAGGYQQTTKTFLNSSEIYNGIGFSAGPNLPNGIAGHKAVLINGQLPFIVGGAERPGFATNKTFIYNGNVWSPSSNLNTSRCNFEVIKNSEDKIFVSGGQTLAKRAIQTQDFVGYKYYWPAQDTFSLSLLETNASNDLQLSGVYATENFGKFDTCADFTVYNSAFGTARAAGAIDPVGDSLFLQGDYSISFWHRALTQINASDFSIFSFGYGSYHFELGIKANKKVFLNYSSSNGSVNNSLETSTNYFSNSRELDWNHICFSKKVNPTTGLIEIKIFLNGFNHFTQSGLPNSSISPAAPIGLVQWRVGPNGIAVGQNNGFFIDEIAVHKRALQESDVAKLFHSQQGVFKSSFETTKNPMFGEVTETCELGAQDGSSWQKLPSMNYARALHQSIALPNGNILICGGIGRSPSSMPESFLNVQSQQIEDDVGIFPNEVLSSCEIFDGNSWVVTSSMQTPRAGHKAVLSRDKRYVIVFGGSHIVSNLVNGVYSKSDISSIEYFDIEKRTWHLAPSKIVGFSERNSFLSNFGALNTQIAVLPNDSVILNLDENGQSTTSPFQVYRPASKKISGKIPNFFSKVSEIISPNEIKVKYPYEWANNSFGNKGAPVLISSISRVSGIVFATVNDTKNLKVGELIQVDFGETLNFQSGIKTVNGINSSSEFTYLEAGASQPLQAINGRVSFGFSNITIKPIKAGINTVSPIGPFLLSPNKIQKPILEANLIDSIKLGTTSTNPIQIQVQSKEWPQSGSISIGNGFSYSVERVDYVSGFYVTPTVFSLIPIFKTEIKEEIPVNAFVGLVQIGDSLTQNSLILTGSSENREFVRKAVLENLAAGIKINYRVNYPEPIGVSKKDNENYIFEE